MEWNKNFHVSVERQNSVGEILRNISLTVFLKYFAVILCFFPDRQVKKTIAKRVIKFVCVSFSVTLWWHELIESWSRMVEVDVNCAFLDYWPPSHIIRSSTRYLWQMFSYKSRSWFRYYLSVECFIIMYSFAFNFSTHLSRSRYVLQMVPSGRSFVACGDSPG